jgi:hypothetical protein
MYVYDGLLAYYAASFMQHIPLNINSHSAWQDIARFLWYHKLKKTKLCDQNPQAKYTDRETAAFRRS